MKGLAKKLEGAGVLQEAGRVARVEDDGFVVRTDAGDFHAKRATSCLVAPEVDDYVLLAAVPRGGCYVLAVLEREGGKVTIGVDGDLELSATKGSVTVAAQDPVRLVSGTQVEIMAPTVDVKAMAATVVVEAASVIGARVTAEIAKVKLVAETFDSVLDRFTQKVKRSFRTVEEIDRVRAESIDYEAKKTLNMHGENALVTAESLVKLDGDQIHVG